MCYQRKGLLIFYQLLLPLYNKYLSEIWEYKCIPYYSEVEKLSDIYIYQIGLGGSYGHGSKYVKIPEFFSMMDAL